MWSSDIDAATRLVAASVRRDNLLKNFLDFAYHSIP